MNDPQDMERAGANARALGRSEFDNPLFRPEKMPASTGESVEQWNAKAEAWRRGWLLEDAIRDSSQILP